MILPNFNDVIDAAGRIMGFAHKTPVLQSETLSKLTNANIFFKCENFQKIGAFKYRGATNAIRSLSPEKLVNGVATHSSGNHAQALALAAKNAGCKAFIVMPENSSQVKVEAVKGYSAEVIFCEPNLQSRETTLEKVVKGTGAEFIHPYDNFYIIAGQATAAKELIEEVGHLDSIIAPVGGGGLLSGTLISAKSMLPKIKVYAAEPEGADDAFRSLTKGRIIPSVNPVTIGDGLLTSLGQMNFEIIKNSIDEIIRVSDDLALKAMKLIWERMKIIIEPSSAFAFAAMLVKPKYFQNQKVGIILSGGNIDLKKVSDFFI